MNSELMISILELTVSIFIGIFTLFLTYYIFTKIYLSRFPKSNLYKNNAFLIFLGGVMISMGYLLSGIISPLTSTLDILISSKPETLSLILEYSKFLGLFLVLGLILGGLINYLSYLIFSNLTRTVDEFEEINKGNSGVAFIVSVIAITIAVFCKEPFLVVLESFIPYPELPRLF